MEPDLESRIKALEDGHQRNANRIARNREGVRTSLAVLVFMVIVFGFPIASAKWSGGDFEFTRDTESPELVIIGGLAAAAIFMGDKPIDLLKLWMRK